MTVRVSLRWCSLALAALAACHHDATGPSDGPAARLDAASDVVRSGVVGTALTTPLVVKVRDATGRFVLGATVTFAVTQGNGLISPRIATTDASGTASATWTLGTLVGANEVTANVNGVATPIKFTATVSAGPVNAVAITPQTLRLLSSIDSTRVFANSLDAYGNITSPSPTFVARDPTLLAVASNGVVRVLRRGASTYVVATAGGRSDSALVTVLAPGESFCTGLGVPQQLSVGQVVTGVDGANVCVHASGPGEDYALVAYYNSAVPSATTQVETKGLGISTATSSSVSALRAPTPPRLASIVVPNDSFEFALRARERQALTPVVVDGARRWYAGRTGASGALRSLSAAAPPAVGDLLSFNVNANEACTNPILRTGRVAAVTNRAIVVADTGNPAGGFTDDEYRAIGVTFDTLTDPVDVAAFGEPTDIDGNGRSILFFTRAVNALTPRGSGSFILGFFYSRDVLPKLSCAASNVAEMFYLLVPDPDGIVSDARSKGLVATNSSGTVAHEYQHLINATRRLYVNGGTSANEDAWLNEGLSHIAEELNFFASAKLAPRANLDGPALTATPAIVAAFQTYQANNFSRFRRYLQSTETQSPIGIDPLDDDLPTRGAVWSFLRYAADHQPGSTGDGTFWYRLVNTTKTGLSNLTDALGTDPAPLLRDWSLSVYMDDNAPGVDIRFQQPSWNMRSAMPAVGSSFALFPRTLGDNITTPVTLTGGGTMYLRFAVPAGQDALLNVTSTGQPLPPTIQLSLVRVR